MKTYTILEIADELITTKSRVSRSISKLKFKANNENERIHKNSPKNYSSSVKELVMIDLMSVTERSVAQQSALQERINKVKSDKATYKTLKEDVKEKAQQSAPTLKAERFEAQQEIIDVLKTQLNKANDEKENLLRLLDQQQRLSLHDRNKIELLETEVKKNTKEEINESENAVVKKSRWYNAWKRNK